MKLNDRISNAEGNWYIAEVIEKLEPVDRNEKKDLRRVTAWGNHYLIKAKSPEKAFDKAEKLGREGEYVFTNTDKVQMEWIFVGIGELIPIYEENIEDGAELMWTDYGHISNKRTMRMPYKRDELLKDIMPKKKLKSTKA